MSALAAVHPRPDAGRGRPARTAETGGSDFEAVLASVSPEPPGRAAQAATPDGCTDAERPADVPTPPAVAAAAQLRHPAPSAPGGLDRQSGGARDVLDAGVPAAAPAVPTTPAGPALPATAVATAPPGTPAGLPATAVATAPPGTPAVPATMAVRAAQPAPAASQDVPVDSRLTQQSPLRATPQVLAERALAAAVVVRQPLTEILDGVVPPLLAAAPADVPPVPASAVPTGAPGPLPVAAAPTAAPVVESPAPLPPAAPPAPAVQVATGLAPLLEGPDGAYTMSLQLYPEELGSVQVEVSLRGGEISLALHAPDEAAREVLRAALPELRTHLESTGLTATGVSVGDGRTDQRTGRDATDRTATRPGDGAGGEPADEPTGLPSASDSSLDVRI